MMADVFKKKKKTTKKYKSESYLDKILFLFWILQDAVHHSNEFVIDDLTFYIFTLQQKVRH